MLWLTILLYVVFFAGFAMTVNEGLWSNSISLLCVMLAGLLAWYWGRALGGFVVDQAEPSAENEWAFWFASLWGTFFVAVMTLRLATDRISRVRMKFVRPLDLAGGILAGLAVAMMLTSFTAYSFSIPFKAGVWKTQEAASWQQQTISTASGPIYNSLRAVFGEDAPDLAN